jgi:hypothetical protein
MEKNNIRINDICVKWELVNGNEMVEGDLKNLNKSDVNK